MYTTSIFLLGIILVYLVIIYIQSKNKKSDQKILIEEHKEKFEEIKTEVSEEKALYEQAAIVAVIAAVIGDTPYSIRRICYIPSFDEKRSNWKISGRNESMMRRVFFKK